MYKNNSIVFFYSKAKENMECFFVKNKIRITFHSFETGFSSFCTRGANTVNSVNLPYYLMSRHTILLTNGKVRDSVQKELLKI